MFKNSDILLLVLAFMIVVFIGLNGCSDQTSIKPIKGDLDRVGQDLIITVKFYKTQKELIGARVEIEPSFDKRQNLQGFAIWSPNDNVCTIYTLTPKRIDDDRTTTLGHEMLHCLIGKYHGE